MKLRANPREHMVCDFCGAKRVFRVFSTRNRTVFLAEKGGSAFAIIVLKEEADPNSFPPFSNLATGHIDADGKWAACVDCTALILRRDAKGLAERSCGTAANARIRVSKKKMQRMRSTLPIMEDRFRIMMDGLEPEMEEIKP